MRYDVGKESTCSCCLDLVLLRISFVPVACSLISISAFYFRVMYFLWGSAPLFHQKKNTFLSDCIRVILIATV